MQESKFELSRFRGNKEFRYNVNSLLVRSSASALQSRRCGTDQQLAAIRIQACISVGEGAGSFIEHSLSKNLELFLYFHVCLLLFRSDDLALYN